MIVDAFQFQAEGPQCTGARWRLDASSAFNGVAKGGGVSKARIARDALGEPNAMLQRQTLEQLLGPFVHIEHSQLQVEHRFAGDTEKEMSRLDDSRVYWTNRHLKHPFTFDFAELMAFALKWRQLRAQIEIFAKRMDIGPIVVQGASAWIRVADQLNPKHILHFALLPINGGNSVRERNEFWPVG